MKTFALFGSNSKEPLQIYEGEEMVQNKEYVSIFKRVRRQNSPIPKQVQVAAIHLGPGQSVKVISDTRLKILETKWPLSADDIGAATVLKIELETLAKGNIESERARGRK